MRKNSLIIVALAGASFAHGTTLYDTKISGIVSNRNPLASQLYAQSFSTGSGGFSLTDVTLLLSNLGGTPASFSLDLFSDVSTAPGSNILHIKTVNDSTIAAGTNQFYNYMLVSPFALSTNTRYWIALTSVSSINSSQVLWDLTNFATASSFPGAFGFASEFTDDNGSIASDSASGGSLLFEMQVNGAGSIVPEPGSVSLILAGLTGLIFLRRRAAR